MRKTQSQIIHAQRRAYERYDLKLSKDSYNELINLIREGKAVTLYRQSNRVSVKMLEHSGKELYFVYDSHRHTIVTFLLKEYIDIQAAADHFKHLQQREKDKFYGIKSWDEVKSQVKKL